MKVSWSGIAFGLGLACAALCADAGVRELPPGAVLVQPERWSVPVGQTEADAASVLQLVARDEADAAFAVMQAWSDPARFELAAARIIETLQAQSSTKATEALLSALAREPVRLYRRHEETAADWFVPVFDIPARAESARRLLAFAQARDTLVANLQRDPRAALQTSKDSAQTVTAALERVPDDVIERIASLASAGDIVLPSRAWNALARRQPEAAILRLSLDRAEAVDLLPLLDELPPRLAPQVAFDWLEQAAGRAEYASAAVLGLGVLAPRSPAAASALGKHLGDPVTGPSAAAALAKLAVPDRLERIDALVAKARTPQVMADLVLALRLEGSDAAAKRLQALESDPRLSAATKAELQR